ncbi:hypothetical protein KBD81_05725 [Candidatus Woesebacteria bacterium]|nr:hypothetical protein [Candidatus Woesebacteria bacterium]
MDLQSWFYTVGIVYMTLMVILMILGIIVFLQIIFFIRNAPKRVEETVSRIIDENKGSLMGMAAMGVLSIIATKMKDMFKK